MTSHLEHRFAPHGWLCCFSGTTWTDRELRWHIPSPLQQGTRRAACPPISLSRVQTQLRSLLRLDLSTPPSRGQLPTAYQNMATEHPEGTVCHHQLLWRREKFSSGSAASLTCSHRSKHQSFCSSGQTPLPTHTSVSHHRTALRFLLLETSSSRRLFAKGLLLLLIVQQQLNQSTSTAKEEGGRNGA